MVQAEEQAVKKAKAGKYLTFKLGDEEYGLEILKVIEIIGLQSITPVPRTPDYLKGVINLRGVIHPVIDLNKKFGNQETKATDQTCIIVVVVEKDGEKQQMGVMVDAVSEVEDIGDADIENTPSLGANINTAFILGMAKTKGSVKILLDVEKVLDTKDMQMLSEISDKTENQA